jgi:uncharacterized protein
MPTRANALAVMAKAPIPGTVKSRLVPPLTATQAAELSRALLLDLLDQLQELSGAERYLCFTPDPAGVLMRAMAGAKFHLIAQRGSDLGERMAAVFTDLRTRGHRSILLIGSDLPAFPLNYLAQAFEYLAAPTARAVLGPSEDGGYYLVGLNQPVPEIFRGMTWSHERVFTQTLARLEALGIPTRQLPRWFDIDTPADLERLRHLDETAAARMKSTLKFLRHGDNRQRPATRTKA